MAAFLRWFVRLWIALACLAVAASVVAEVAVADERAAAAGDVLRWFSPHNILNLLALCALVVPALLGNWWYEHVSVKRLPAAAAIEDRIAGSPFVRTLTLGAYVVFGIYSGIWWIAWLYWLSAHGIGWVVLGVLCPIVPPAAAVFAAVVSPDWWMLYGFSWYPVLILAYQIRARAAHPLRTTLATVLVSGGGLLFAGYWAVWLYWLYHAQGIGWLIVGILFPPIPGTVGVIAPFVSGDWSLALGWVGLAVVWLGGSVMPEAHGPSERGHRGHSPI